MGKQAECCSTHLIDGDGIFNGTGLDNFIKQVKMGELGLSYAVVAIMGPQSSGKSTLLNHLFRTNFKEMNAHDGRSQTTLGVWMAKCNDIEPCTIVMDLEGNDGRERGKDDTAFEKQIALFALAVSDYENCTDQKTCSSDGIEDSFPASLAITEGEAIYDYCWYPYMSAAALLHLNFAGG